MEPTLNFLASYQGAITAIATIVIAASAVVTTILTRKLARENELLRKAGTEPEVVAYLDIGSYFINFVLANVGQGPAQKVKFSIESDDFRFSDDLPSEQKIFLRNNTERTAISFLPQGENIRVVFCFDRILFAKPKLPPFDVLIEYENIKGKAYKKTVKLDISQFLGFASPPPPQIETDLVNVLKKIEKHFNNASRTISDGFGGARLKVEMKTYEETRQENEEWLARMDQESAAERRNDDSPESKDSA